MSAPQGTSTRVNDYKTTLGMLRVVEGFNVRFDLGDLQALSDSIVEHGVERTLNVHRDEEGNFALIDGHRRYAAMQLALKARKIDNSFQVPIKIADRALTAADRVAMMARANDGKALLPLEEATLYQRLLREHLTIADVCKAVGRGDVHVRDRLSLLTAAPEVQEAVKEGKLAATLAQQIVAFSKKGKVDAEAAKEKQREMLKKTTSSKESKKAVRESVDTESRKKAATSAKLSKIKEGFAAVQEAVRVDLRTLGYTRVQLKEKVGKELFDVVFLMGQESALRGVINAATH